MTELVADRVRPAGPADLPALARLETEAFGVDAWTGDALTGIVADPGRRAVVAADPDDRAVGWAVSRLAGDVVDLERIVVRPTARRRGTSTALLGDLLAHTGDGDRMLLEVAATNRAAIGFYAAHGFSQIDVRPRYYRDGTDALVLRRALVAGCGGGAR